MGIFTDIKFVCFMLKAKTEEETNQANETIKKLRYTFKKDLVTVDFTFEFQGEQVTFEVSADYVFRYRFGYKVIDGKVVKRTKEEIDKIVSMTFEKDFDEETLIEDALKDKDFCWWLVEEITEEYNNALYRLGKGNMYHFFKNWD